MKKGIIIAGILLLFLASFLFYATRKPALVPVVVPTPVSTPVAVMPVPRPVSSPIKEKPVKPEIKKGVVAKPILTPKPIAAPVAPPKVEIHKELIPKDISIVRVYYADPLTGPDARVEFDINGSGFTKEFQNMITVQSGHPNVGINNLSLVTLNQIHGTLVVASTAPTVVVFPQVLIGGKVVFQAPDPFFIIRPGEVLNMALIDRGPEGKSGRFRILTNLTPAMFSQFFIEPSTPTIQVVDIVPNLPFIVDATTLIGPVPPGDYGVKLRLGEKIIWERTSFVHIIETKVGETGLVQRVLASDGFYRPGDSVKLMVQGSGFQPKDADVLQVRLQEFGNLKSSFTFVAPGRLDLSLQIPLTAFPKTYGIDIAQGDKVLLHVDNIFTVVPPNWIRIFKLDPPLTPGGKSTLTLEGRDLEKDFINSLTTALEEPSLQLGKFVWLNSAQASAPITAGPAVAAGDYLLTLTSHGQPLHAQFGNIIPVEAKK